VLNLDVEEKSTGQLELSAGYSSLERFIISSSISQRNFMGKGQVLQTGVSYSKYSKSVQAGFTEPFLFDKNILLGGELFYRDYSSFNYNGNGDRNQTYGQTSIGGIVRLGFPVTEYVSFGTRYSLIRDNITLDKSQFYTDPNGTDPLVPTVCDPLKAGRYLCQEVGKRLTSAIGYTVAYDDTNGIRATRGQRISAGQDFAGLGGDEKYLRTRLDATKYFGLPKGFVLSVHGEGGYIYPLQNASDPGQDPIRLSDRFYGPQMRGFDIRGIGPRVIRVPYEDANVLESENSKNVLSDALGGRAYYMGRIEVEFPATSALKNLGLRPSAFVDVGSVWKLTSPALLNVPGACIGPDSTADTDTNQDVIALKKDQTCAEAAVDKGRTATDAAQFSFIANSGFREFYRGDSVSPRLSVGIGVNWVSPFGPLRIDIAKALLKQKGDETKFFSFNVGTQF
jgi:outer membrane protein insertion porin family